jgi:hypothetical protein
VRDEVKEILRSLSEALRHPGFAAAVALVVSTKTPGEGSDLAERIAPGASGAGAK